MRIPREKVFTSSRHLTESDAQAFLLDDSSSGTWRDSRMPQWHAVVKQRLHDLLKLEANWDSYGANAPSRLSANDLLSVLALIMNEDTPAPSIVPCVRGHFQAEWHTNGVDLEVEVVTLTEIPTSYVDATTDWECTFDFDFTKLIKAVALVGRVS